MPCAYLYQIVGMDGTGQNILSSWPPQSLGEPQLSVEAREQHVGSTGLSSSRSDQFLKKPPGPQIDDYHRLILGIDMDKPGIKYLYLTLLDCFGRYQIMAPSLLHLELQIRPGLSNSVQSVLLQQIVTFSWQTSLPGQQPPQQNIRQIFVKWDCDPKSKGFCFDFSFYLNK